MKFNELILKKYFSYENNNYTLIKVKVKRYEKTTCNTTTGYINCRPISSGCECIQDCFYNFRQYYRP